MTVELETWVNETRATWLVNRLNPDGTTRQEMVRGNATVMLTPQERELNQSNAKPALDPFLNGTFTCLAGDSAPESSNRLTDDDIEELLSGHWKRAAKRLEEITSEAALTRVLNVALESGAGAKRIEMVRDRILEINPRRVFPTQSRSISPQSELQGVAKPTDLIPEPPKTNFQELAGNLMANL
ncbi:MAG: hypothetical protein KA758_03725 [Acidimicrobiales bacterium]|jgi:hypothetical protein|nr:hypothetical protein [Acidimicrobiales bacterium]